MNPKLPPPDPNEALHFAPARETNLPGPLAVFVGCEPDPEHDRLSDAILDLRPGLLIVCAG
jgi:hypothetical protein